MADFPSVVARARDDVGRAARATTRRRSRRTALVRRLLLGLTIGIKPSNGVLRAGPGRATRRVARATDDRRRRRAAAVPALVDARAVEGQGTSAILPHLLASTAPPARAGRRPRPHHSRSVEHVRRISTRHTSGWLSPRPLGRLLEPTPARVPGARRALAPPALRVKGAFLGVWFAAFVIVKGSSNLHIDRGRQLLPDT